MESVGDGGERSAPTSCSRPATRWGAAWLRILEAVKELMAMKPPGNVH